MQIQKEKIKTRILLAARQNFLKKGFRNSSMREIAKNAKISTSNLYTYFTNKEHLFYTLISSVYEKIKIFQKELVETEKSIGEEEFFDKIIEVVSESISILIKDNRVEFLLLLDKSQGTKYASFKSSLIKAIEDHFVEHILSQARYKEKDFEQKFVIHIIATNFLEGFLEIARHCKSDKLIDESIKAFLDYHINGIRTFF